MIKHIQCDIFKSGADVIVHQVNCQGAMNSGVAKQVRERYPWVYATYKRACDNAEKSGRRMLGRCQEVFIDENRAIVNAFAQENYGYDGKCYTDYEALRNCFGLIKEFYKGKTIAIPYLMACHRGGGDWTVVIKMIESIFNDDDITVLICEYNGG
jgi:O-acetyl-ADP-ribose deacetylase (regulator of RNase III)